MNAKLFFILILTSTLGHGAHAQAQNLKEDCLLCKSMGKQEAVIKNDTNDYEAALTDDKKYEERIQMVRHFGASARMIISALSSKPSEPLLESITELLAKINVYDGEQLTLDKVAASCKPYFFKMKIQAKSLFDKKKITLNEYESLIESLDYEKANFDSMEEKK